jgi:hypothetical protein
MNEQRQWNEKGGLKVGVGGPEKRNNNNKRKKNMINEK